MSLGGLLDDKKSDTNKLIPKKYLPESYSVSTMEDCFRILIFDKLQYPVIIKPDIGLKGIAVSKIDNTKQLENYFQQNNIIHHFLMQEYIDLREEYSFLFYKIPNSIECGISSFVKKEYPFVIGDGKSSLQQLITKNKNPFLKKQGILQVHENEINKLIPAGQKFIIETIGNYSRGSKFYSFQNKIDQHIINTSKQLFSQINGLNFTRVDLKTNSLEHLINGDFKILEINGAKSEPLHIYDANISWIEIMKSIHHHWNIVYKIINIRMKGKFKFPKSVLAYKGYLSLKKLSK